MKTRTEVAFKNWIDLMQEEDKDYLDKSADEREAIEAIVIERYSAYIIITKSDQEMYRDLKDTMKQHHSVG